MYRYVVDDLVAWSEKSKRRILYIKGALSVGKTWAIKDFATGYFESYRYISLAEDNEIADIVSLGYVDNSILEIIAVEPYPLDNPTVKNAVIEEVKRLDQLLNDRYGDEDYEKCMLILDDAEGISLTDIFFHQYRKIHSSHAVCVIASTMEVSPYQYHYKDIFEVLRIRPMSFEEYLMAQKEHALITAIRNNKTKTLSELEEVAIKARLKEYMMIGGMPEVVNHFIKHKNMTAIRPLQQSIVKRYEQIIIRGLSSSMSQRCRRIWRSLPAQLERNNKKFMYNAAEPNARAREYSDATQILCNLGFVRKLPKLKNASLPLEANADYNSFELFLLDHGLLRTIYNLPNDEDLSLSDIFAEKNGAVAEQYIFQELSNKLGYLYYWVSGATARIPFVYESDDLAVPVDIQIKERKKAQSIKVFTSKNSNIQISLKISMEQVSFEKNILNVPVYSLWNLI